MDTDNKPGGPAAGPSTPPDPRVVELIVTKLRNEMRYMAPDDEIDRYIEAKKMQFAKMTTLQLMRGVLVEWTKVDMTGPH